MFAHLRKSRNQTPIILSESQETRMLAEQLTIAINALLEYSTESNWSKVNCWGTTRKRRWRGQLAEQEGFDLAQKALEEIGVEQTTVGKDSTEPKCN